MQRIFSEIMHLKERTKYQSAKQKEREEEKKDVTLERHQNGKECTQTYELNKNK